MLETGLQELNPLGNQNGKLIALENYKNIPFGIKRVYFIYGTPPDVRRGFHAHKKTDQVLICTSGGCNILLDDGYEKKSVRLSNPQQALFLPTMIWHEMDEFTPDCVLMVLASELYEEEDYIRDYDEFMEELKR